MLNNIAFIEKDGTLKLPDGREYKWEEDGTMHVGGIGLPPQIKPASTPSKQAATLSLLVFNVTSDEERGMPSTLQRC